MRKILNNTSLALAVMATAIVAVSPLNSQQQVSEEQTYRVINKIRKRILGLSGYGVFDYISFGLKGGTSGFVVPLNGYASRPQLKRGAERATQRVEGYFSYSY